MRPLTPRNKKLCSGVCLKKLTQTKETARTRQIENDQIGQMPNIVHFPLRRNTIVPQMQLLQTRQRADLSAGSLNQIVLRTQMLETGAESNLVQVLDRVRSQFKPAETTAEVFDVCDVLELIVIQNERREVVA